MVSTLLQPLKNSRGFTLVEMLVVAAIVGILAAVAVPNYMKYAARARQAEAKIALAGIYTAEKTYHVEAFTYNLCLRELGYEPYAPERYYLAGFWAPNVTNDCGPDGLGGCANEYPVPAAGATGLCACAWTPSGNNCTIGATRKVDSNFTVPGWLNGNETFGMPASLLNSGQVDWGAHQNTFRAGAAANISTGSAVGYDVWTIDEQKQILNIQSGL